MRLPLIALSLSLVSAVAGGRPAVAAGPAARPVLDRLAAATTLDARTQAVDVLVKLDPVPVDELAAELRRARRSSDADRRALLLSHKFAVPDEKGKFSNPGRETEAQEKGNDKLDWFAAVATAPSGPAVSDLLVDLAIIRALAATSATSGAQAILQFAFTPDGIAYRDECGRFLRRMSPWSLPALILAAEGRAKGEEALSRKRYAKYQLERLDRENPRKALNGAPTDALMVEILEAFAESQYREAVFVVLETVDHVSPQVRQAAREAWIEYATGRPPPPVPKEKLNLPGGKQTEEEMPLWLDHRELADIAIRRKLKELTGADPPPKAKLGEMSSQLFAWYDAARTRRLDAELEAGLAEAKSGKAAEAAARFDQVLVQDPEFARRAEMAEVYTTYGEQLESGQKWREAASAYAKASAVAPPGPVADKALAQHHRARGKMLEASGKSGAAEMARASEIDASAARSYAVPGAGDRRWMLYAGVGGGIGGLLLIAWGLAWRRRSG